MNPTWYRWAVQLLLEKLTEKITPETIAAVKAAAIHGARSTVQAAKDSAAKTENKWDDMAASAAGTILEAIVAAAGAP